MLVTPPLVTSDHPLYRSIPPLRTPAAGSVIRTYMGFLGHFTFDIRLGFLWYILFIGLGVPDLLGHVVQGLLTSRYAQRIWENEVKI